MTFTNGFGPSKKEVKRNNFTKENAPFKGGGRDKKDAEMVANLQADYFLEELDFDKVVKDQGFAERSYGSTYKNMVYDENR